MTDPIDLDALDRLYAKATPGDWSNEPGEVEVTGGKHYIVPIDDMDWSAQRPDDGAFIAAIHNAYPALAARIRELEAEIKRRDDEAVPPNWQ